MVTSRLVGLAAVLVTVVGVAQPPCALASSGTMAAAHADKRATGAGSLMATACTLSATQQHVDAAKLGDIVCFEGDFAGSRLKITTGGNRFIC